METTGNEFERSDLMSNDLTISEIMADGFETSFRHGFWMDWYGLKCDDDAKPMRYHWIGSNLQCIGSEVSEAHEVLRDSDVDEISSNDRFAEELADVIIRTCSLAHGLDIDLQSAIERKMARNENRPLLHGRMF